MRVYVRVAGHSVYYIKFIASNPQWRSRGHPFVSRASASFRVLACFGPARRKSQNSKICVDKTGDAEPDPMSARAADQIRQTPRKDLTGAFAA